MIHLIGWQQRNTSGVRKRWKGTEKPWDGVRNSVGFSRKSKQDGCLLSCELGPVSSCWTRTSILWNYSAALIPFGTSCVRPHRGLDSLIYIPQRNSISNVVNGNFTVSLSACYNGMSHCKITDFRLFLLFDSSKWHTVNSRRARWNFVIQPDKLLFDDLLLLKQTSWQRRHSFPQYNYTSCLRGLISGGAPF